MICPRCASGSVVRNHATVACMACGHILDEPVREAWDGVASAGRRVLRSVTDAPVTPLRQG